MQEIIPIASDHAGYELKGIVISYLQKKGYGIKDFGTYSSERCDYPDFAHPLAASINNGIYPRGILICGSGNGVSMTANKYSNVRCALCWNEEIASLARQHNDANIVAMPARFIPSDMALRIVDTFLITSFEGGRHTQRVQKIKQLIS